MILSIKNYFFQKLGIDKAISYSLLTQIVGAIRTLGAIFLVTKFLTPTEQGFYYTFMSILAIQIFFELGFSGIITQYAAHERVYLTWEGNTLAGNEINHSRLRSLLRLCVKWFSVMSVILLVVLLISGFVFFSYFAPNNENVNWQIPWVLMAVTTATNLFVSPFIAFYTGLGKVENTTRLSFISLIITTVAFFTALYFNTKLYAYAINNILALLVSTIWLYSDKIKITFLSIWNYPISKHTISWRKEIFPYQWKIALSWISGYFLFQLFNPILFSTVGAEAAGQMGITQAILNGIFGLCSSWFSTKIPVFSGLIAQKNYKELDNIFFVIMKQTLIVFLSCLVALAFIIFLISKYNTTVIGRFLGFTPFSILAFSSFLLFINWAFAVYLRCHKEEPFFIQSIVCGILNIFTVFFSSKYYGVIGMSIGYFAVILLSLIWGYIIFINKKRSWHQNNG